MYYKALIEIIIAMFFIYGIYNAIWQVKNIILKVLRKRRNSRSIDRVSK